MKAADWDPINVSVVSIKGQQYYTAFYEKRDGGYLLKSFLTHNQFDETFAKQKQAKRHLAYINVTHMIKTLYRVL